MHNLENKTILVTGASRGIGKAAAQSLAEAGARVLVHYGSRKADAESVAKGIRDSGGEAEVLGGDLSTPDGPHRLADAVKSVISGRLDGLVANAGIGKSASIENVTVEDFDLLFSVNVRAPYFLVQQLLPLFAHGSSVTFVSSVVARSTIGTLTAYAATKGAISTLTRHIALALGPAGIRVNAVAPGVVDTDMSTFTGSEDGRSLALSFQALQRIATPDDIAGVITFLVSEQARWITGEVIAVDGGSKI